MRTYNKSGNPNADSPAIQFHCSNDSQFFIMTHLMDKYLPIFWRLFFEKQLVINTPDLYQFHCYVIKKSRWGALQPRFFVCSMVFLYNTECDFDKESGEIKFKKLKWIVPIEAMTKIDLVEHRKSEKLQVKIHINEICQKFIL